VSPRSLARASVRQPLRVPVPADDEAFAARKGAARLALRTARRALLLRISGQQRHLQTRLAQSWRRLLWIHEGMPQIGDALMDLAPRSLLTESGFQVDLFAAPHIAQLFAGDAWFGRVISDPADLQADRYDAAIVLSHDHKAMRLKRDRLAALPWVSLQGFYGGPDFHRARFATQRLCDLLDLTLAPEVFARHSAQKLSPSPSQLGLAAAGCVALVLGGVWPERTYTRWWELVEALRAQGSDRLLLLGAANGREMADRILARGQGLLEMHDHVGRTSLREAQGLIARSALVVCADGGLMHLALTTPAPVVALFGAAIRPEWRLPIGRSGNALQSEVREVDGVSPQRVAEAVRRVIG